MGNRCAVCCQQHIICICNCPAHFRISHGQFRQHIQFLGSLSGKQYCYLSLFLCRFCTICNFTLYPAVCHVLFQKFQGFTAFLLHFNCCLCCKCQTYTAFRIFVVAVFVLIPQSGVILHSFCQSLYLFCQFFLCPGRKHHTHRCRCHTISLFIVTLCFFQYHMVIGSAKTKCTDSRPSYRLTVIHNPGLWLRQYTETGIHQYRIRSAHIDGSRKCFFMQGQCCFDKTCNTCRHTQMSNLTFYASNDGITSVTVFGINFGNCTDFTGITSGCSRSMGFNQTNGFRFYFRIFISTVQRTDLPFLTRCIDTFRPTIPGGSHTADYRINLISIPFCIRKSF